MADIYNIEDNMAFACTCGSVKFNLLKSGSIECDGCQSIQREMTWGNKVNPNVDTKESEGLSRADIDTAKVIIKQAIIGNEQCFWPDIVREKPDNMTSDALLAASREMQHDKQIRLKEDDLEHDMEYLLS